MSLGIPHARDALIAIAVTSLVFTPVVTLMATAAQKAQKKPANNKAAKKSAEPVDPSGRPEGALAAKLGAKSARYYVWRDKQGWHIRTTANGTRRFHGTVRVKDGTIASCIPVGLKDRQKTQDAWRVEPKRKELAFDFKTSSAADGLDIQIDGADAELEFDLLIENEKKPRAVFLGKAQQHPSEVPFRFKAAPKAESKEK
jgi:hypothetical protein